jgi:hypothetical protein
VVNLLKNVRKLRLLLPETVDLEPEDFVRARQKSDCTGNEAHLWQIYLNILAQLSLVKWLGERMPEAAIAIDESSPIEGFGKIRVNDFSLSAIATEQILDEVVNFPEREFISPKAAHFYVLVEVSEEQEQVMIRGCLRYDRLSQYLSAIDLPSPNEGYYQLPLSIFETEPHHLLFYCCYLKPSSIWLPSPTTEPVYLSTTRTKLSNWLSGIVGEYWQAIEQVTDRQINLSLNTRNLNIDKAVSKIRLINLGMRFGDRTVALIIKIAPETEAKLKILAQLFPSGEEKYLPSNLKITLLSKAGKILQEVITRSQDNYIQLKPFKGEFGKRFSLEISLLEMSLRQDFEL